MMVGVVAADRGGLLNEMWLLIEAWLCWTFL